MSQPGAPGPQVATYPCPQCGARVTYAPGTTSMTCPYCGYVQAIEAVDDVIEEHSFDDWAREDAALPDKAVDHSQHALRCQKCGATSQSADLSFACPFCGAPVVVDPTSGGSIAPEALVPFEITATAAKEAFRRWVTSRWFAPGSLKKVAATEQLNGTYLPHWTYDADTVSRYVGQRGEHYWETETYTEMVDGQAQTRTRQVQRTRWWPASGTVARTFDDVLVPGTRFLPPGRLDAMGPWSLERSLPFQPEFLSGYRTLRYDIEPDEGLADAKQRMASVIEDDCRADIGGDEQRVHHVDTRYADLMFKLVLLPVWIAVYLHAGRSFQVLVNAHSGQVVGDRPYSVPKIVAAVIAAVVVIGAVVAIYAATRSGG
ncbi:MAG: hypothetical protein U0Q15_13160 [Kineosporiaceae bacterium]